MMMMMMMMMMMLLRVIPKNSNYWGYMSLYISNIRRQQQPWPWQFFVHTKLHPRSFQGKYFSIHQYIIQSMYGILNYICLIFMLNVGKCKIHGCFGIYHVESLHSTINHGTRHFSWPNFSIVPAKTQHRKKAARDHCSGADHGTLFFWAAWGVHDSF